VPTVMPKSAIVIEAQASALASQLVALSRNTR
jgi:hypothetical protein